MKRTFSMVVALLFAASPTVLCAAEERTASKPNVVLILAEHVELYDLAADGGENRDLAADQPQRAAEMKELLAQWRRSVAAQMPTANPNPVDPFGPGAVDRPQAKKAKRKTQASDKPGG